MKLSELKPAHGSRKKRTRVGRGESSGHGKTCGRGGKGQTARSGGTVAPWFEGGQTPLYRRLPKRGFTSWQSHKLGHAFEVSLSDLERFDNGATVDLAALKAKQLLHGSTVSARVKVLSNGTLSKKLTLKVHAISKAAQAKVEAAGGSVELIVTPPTAAKSAS